MFTFVSETKAQDVSNKTLINIANSVYKMPEFKDYRTDYGTPEILTKTTANLTQNEINQIPATSCFYGAKPGVKYYIVRYPYDINKQSFEEVFSLEVYIWANSQRVFAVRTGDSFMTKFNYGGNGKPDYDDNLRIHTISYSGKTSLLSAGYPVSTTYGNTFNLTLIYSYYQGYQVDHTIQVSNGSIVGSPSINIDAEEKPHAETVLYHVTKRYKVKCTGDMSIIIN